MSVFSEFATANGLNFIRKDSDLSKHRAIVFDIDGTLVDSRSSYNEAIYSTASAFYGWIAGIKPPRDLVYDAVARLRLTGGFNNDWDTTYAIIMGLLSGLPDEVLREASLDDFRFFRTPIRSKFDRGEALESSSKALGYALMYADEKGLTSFDEGIRKLYNRKDKLNYLLRLKEKLNYPGLPQKSILSGVFEEFYLGADLYREFWKTEPIFKIKRGLVENERVVLDADTKSYLKKKFGKNIGIASGRPKRTAYKVLEEHMGSFFNEQGSFFIDDVYYNSKDRWLGKPDPFLLEQAMKGMSTNECIYVGDSFEDLLLVENTRKNGYDVRFVGVYGLTPSPKSFAEKFLKSGADAVIPSVNDLKFIL
ncbi:MAG: HAD family hydrolase [Nitrososphaeria archaeon]